MTESEHMSNLHVVEPQYSQKNLDALGFYLLMVKANPWLPDSMKVAAGSTLDLSVQKGGPATLTLTVFVDLPAGFDEEI